MRTIELKKSILTFIMLPLLIIASVGLEYNQYYNTFSMKLSVPLGISADIKWIFNPTDKNDSLTENSATLTDGRNVNLPVEFFMKKFSQGDSRDSTTQNLIDLWRHCVEARNNTPTISKLKNGDYIVSGPYNSKMLRTVRTFDFNQDGQLDCYFIFTGYGNEGVHQYLLNDLASSADVVPYSVANWNPYY